MQDRDKVWWAKRLTNLYDSAKRRNGGLSLSIYQDVTDLLDYLEGEEEIPEGFDLAQACDNLASRLHRV